MNERNRNREEQLDRVFARVRAVSLPSQGPDPHLPTRIRAMSRAGSEAAGDRRRFRWALASLATAAVVFAAGLGTWVGHRAAAASQSLTHEEASDADVFMTALSQGGVVDDLSRLAATNREVNQ